MIKQGILVAIGMSLAAGAVFSASPNFMFWPQFGAKVEKSSEAVLPVTVITAKAGPSTTEFVLPGTTHAIQEAPIYARVPGYLHTRYVDMGDRVHAGQVLAEIDTPELDKQVQAAASATEQAGAVLESSQQVLKKAQADALTAAANVQLAKTNLEFYTTELGRYENLAKAGAVSLEARDSKLQAYNSETANLDAKVAAQRSAQATVNSARAAVHVAEAALNADKAQYRQYYAHRSFKTVTAPFEGVITSAIPDPGALITSGSSTGVQVIFQIAKTDVLRVFVNVPEQYVSIIHLGEQVKLTFQEFPAHDFVGTIADVSGGITADSKTLQVEIHMANPTKKLLPGMYAQVKFQEPTKERIAIVPATTVQMRAAGTFAYTVDSNNRVHAHSLSLGRDLGGSFEVIKDLVPGDKVIVNPPYEVQDGMLVKPSVVPDPKDV